MLSVKGTYADGVARPNEPVSARDGQDVIITFLEAPLPEPDNATLRGGWSQLLETIEACQVDTGIPDLAQQHDHYLYGTPKRE